MNKTLIQLCFVIVSIITFQSCNDNEIVINNPNVIVYCCANVETNGAESTCQYYIDNTPYLLNNDTNIFAFATSMCVSGKDIYVSGYTRGNGDEIATYWKNGNATSLSGTRAKCIEVKDTNIYVSGSEEYKTAVYGVLWKNGHKMRFTKEWQTGSINSIYISDNSIYMAGYESTNMNGYRLLYWKNNIETYMGNNIYSSGGFKAIFVDNNDIYLTGGMHKTDDQYFNYWKNDQPYTLQNGEPSWFSNSLYVYNNNVYIAGCYHYTNERSIAKYWKNGKEINLTDNKADAYANSIFVYGKDVYVGGRFNDKPCYWVNGKRIDLKSDHNGEVISIVVKPK